MNNISIKVIRRKAKITMEMKKKIIEKHESGMRVVDIARFYGKPTSTICTILKKKNNIKGVRLAKGISKLSKQRSQVLEDMEKLLLIWVNQKQLVGDAVTKNCIVTKAKSLYTDLLSKSPCSSVDDDGFKASRGWLENFKRRSGIREDSSKDLVEEQGKDFTTDELLLLLQDEEQNEMLSQDEESLNTNIKEHNINKKEDQNFSRNQIDFFIEEPVKIETSSPISSRSHSPSTSLLKENVDRMNFSKEIEEELTITKVWSEKLQSLDRHQSLFAEKAINDVLFEATLGNLHKHSVKINEVKNQSATSSYINFVANVLGDGSLSNMSSSEVFPISFIQPFAWTQTNIIRLIKLYEKNHVLWNHGHPDFHDKGERIKAIRKMSKALGVTGDEIKRKIETLLAQYRREQKQLKNPNRTRWYGYEHMTFLDNRKTKLFISTETNENDSAEDIDNTSKDDSILESITDYNEVDGLTNVKIQELRAADVVSECDEQPPTRSELNTYGLTVVDRLKKIQDPLMLCLSKNKIDHVLFNAEIQQYKTNVSNKLFTETYRNLKRKTKEDDMPYLKDDEENFMDDDKCSDFVNVSMSLKQEIDSANEEDNCADENLQKSKKLKFNDDEQQQQVQEQQRQQLQQQLRQETEFDVFSRSVALHLNSLPLENALRLQHNIQNLVIEERLRCLRNTQNEQSDAAAKS